DSHPYGDQFRAAAATEFHELEKKVIFRPIPQSVPLSAKAQILPLLWVFTYKFDTDGYLVKFKARICVRGDLQRPDDQTTYAATLAARTFRALMAVTAAFDLETRHLDAVNAFLNSSLDETIYCHFPDGFKQLERCLLLLKALYGLCRSPLLWLNSLSTLLLNLELRKVDLALFCNN